MAELEFESDYAPYNRTPIGIQVARAKLNTPEPAPSPWPLMGAAALAAATAIVCAAAVIMGPPNLGPDSSIGQP